jgi:transposase
MARPSLLTPEQQAEVRRLALRARAESTHRGRGATGGACGRNPTEIVRAFIAETYGVEYTERGVQKLLGRLGLVYEHRAMGGFWAERR